MVTMVINGEGADLLFWEDDQGGFGDCANTLCFYPDLERRGRHSA